MIKAPISGYWAVTANEREDINDSSYFAWVVAKDAARGISTLFLMGLFLKVDARSLPQRNRDVRINHFLVPTIMLAILGALLESLVDQYVGPLDSRLRFVSRCNKTVNSTLLFFVPVCFNLFSFLCLSFFSFVCSFLDGNIAWLYFDQPNQKPSFFITFTFSSFFLRFSQLSGKQRDKMHNTWHATNRSTVTSVV